MYIYHNLRTNKIFENGIETKKNNSLFSFLLVTGHHNRELSHPQFVSSLCLIPEMSYLRIICNIADSNKYW